MFSNSVAVLRLANISVDFSLAKYAQCSRAFVMRDLSNDLKINPRFAMRLILRTHFVRYFREHLMKHSNIGWQNAKRNVFNWNTGNCKLLQKKLTAMDTNEMCYLLSQSFYCRTNSSSSSVNIYFDYCR